MKNLVTLLGQTMTNKKNGGKEVLIELGLVIIGVVLLIIFKTQLTTLLNTAGASVSTKITALFD